MANLTLDAKVPLNGFVNIFLKLSLTVRFSFLLVDQLLVSTVIAFAVESQLVIFLLCYGLPIQTLDSENFYDWRNENLWNMFW